MSFHKSFGKIFRTLQLRRRSGRAENRQPRRTEVINNTRSQRRFWADNGKRYIFGTAKLDQILMIRFCQIR